MALPQCAMAQLGSRSAAWEKVCSASWYWKECKRATPVTMAGCAAAEQLVGNWTLPRASVEAKAADDRPSQIRTEMQSRYSRMGRVLSGRRGILAERGE